MKYEQEIRDNLKEHDLLLEDLTIAEDSKLQAEIENEKNGGFTLDSVLDDPAIYYRNAGKGKGNN